MLLLAAQAIMQNQNTKAILTWQQWRYCVAADTIAQNGLN
jgi:hypothetical protein